MAIHTVTGGGGIGLSVSEHGNPDGRPILFIHGWSQSALCWAKQYEAADLSQFRLVGFDLRGHGMSDRPSEPEDYSTGDGWADDVAAVIAERGLERAILVGWSYGGMVACDYLRKYGTERVGGVNFVGAAIVLGQSAFGTKIGPGFFEHAPGACTPDLGENIRAIRSFLHGLSFEPLAAEDFETVLAFNMVVPSWVRGAMIQRDVDFAPVLRNLDLPVLVSHGREDKAVLPAMAEYALESCARATASWYEGAGHIPFLEQPERFNRELAAFARGV